MEVEVSARMRVSRPARNRGRAGRIVLLIFGLLQLGLYPGILSAQSAGTDSEAKSAVSHQAQQRHSRTTRYMAGRQSVDPTVNPSAARQAATVQHLAMLQAAAAQPQYSPLTATWQSIGPAQANSIAYGNITGRISSVAIDPSDTSGNTVYVGSTGGGVWKSVNAAGSAGSVAFTPLTDDLAVFSISSGTSAIASLSIGAVTVQPGGTGVVLAGTGDPNDALDSYYGEGILRSANGGQTWSLIQTSAHGLYPAYYFGELFT
jgi:hypothetical protein